MAEGVDGCQAIVCFMTQKYQESKNCKRELTYADTQNKEIIPCMAQNEYKAQSWLGIITAGLLWMNFRFDVQQLLTTYIFITDNYLRTDGTVSSLAVFSTRSQN